MLNIISNLFNDRAEEIAMEISNYSFYPSTDLMKKVGSEVRFSLIAVYLAIKAKTNRIEKIKCLKRNEVIRLYNEIYSHYAVFCHSKGFRHVPDLNTLENRSIRF